jgi:CheY-like chemotaxis protein
MPHKLLLADDSITIQRVIELTFADEDVDVIAVGTGQAAIDRAERDRPDIVLADVAMPERDGYEVAAFVKSHPQLSHVPVVLLTGAFEPIDESRARAVGCDGVLVKPFEPLMVIERVRDLLAGHRAPAMWDSGPTAQGPLRPAVLPPPREPSAPLEPFRSEALVPLPAERTAPVNDQLDAYFDRLDAAVSARAIAPKPPPPQTPPAASLADAFAALLTAEARVPAPAEPQAGPQPAPPAHDAEALLDTIVDRVLARLHDSSLRTVVLEAAERMVREEIERLKRD